MVVVVVGGGGGGGESNAGEQFALDTPSENAINIL